MILLPNQPHEPEIALQTRLARDIPNNQSYEIGNLEAKEFAKLEKQFPTVQYRTEPLPFFNCHGLTFASRRTLVSETGIIPLILQDDGYIEIPPKDVLEGDVIIYLSENDNSAEHSGIVVTPPQPPLNVPMIISKWGRFREVIHPAHVCPYFSGDLKYYRVTR